MTTRARVHRLVGALVCLGFLVVAGLVAHTIPITEDWAHPLDVDGSIGQTVAGRNISVRADAPRLAERIETDDWVGETPGVWVVVSVRAQTVVDDLALLRAVLNIDGTRYSASERPDLDTVAERSLLTGIPTSGDIAFEIPTDRVSGSARLEFSTSTETRGDSVVVVPVELSRLSTADSIELARVETGTK